MREIVVLAGAESDLLRTYCWFEALDGELATRFDEAVNDALFLLSEQPGIGSHFRGIYRRMLVPGFRCFGVFYSLEDGARLCVAAVLDLRQDPQAILRRLGIA